MNILIIAYLFPPDSGSGSFRPMFFARYLHDMGETVSVLTVREQDYMPYQTKDQKLLDYLPDDIQIFRSRVRRPREALLALRERLTSKADHPPKEISYNIDEEGLRDATTISFTQQVKDTITDLLAMPDPEIGWLPSAVRMGREIINTNAIDVIYVTAAPWTNLLIGVTLKKFTRIPLVIDFRDPWVSNPVFLLKSKLSRILEGRMERYVLRTADHIITNTEVLKHDFLHRYAFLSADTLTTITNGFEAYISSPEEEQDSSRFTLLHAGTLIFRNPQALLQAAINLIEQRTIPQDELRIVFLGGVDFQGLVSDDVLKHPYLKNVLDILPRMPYQEAVQFQGRSDVLFLIQPEEFPLQIPRKLYEYMAFRKPILAITPSVSATAEVVEENNIGLVVDNQVNELEEALLTLHTQWKQGAFKLAAMRKSQKTAPRVQNKRKSDKFLNKNLTIRLREVLRGVCGHPEESQ